MTDRIETMNASMKALMTLLEGKDDWEERTASILYSAFTGWDGQLVQACCDATIDHGYDGILAFFDPDTTAAGPARICVTMLDGAMIKVQAGRLWMAPGATRAVLVPRAVGKRHGHYLVENGRVVQRPEWPAETLERGTRRAEARLAELTAEYARAALAQEGALA